MYIPEELMYTETHEWVKFLRGGRVAVGLTEYAVKSLGEITYVSLPEEEYGLLAGESFAELESAAGSHDVYSPVDGIVCEVNEMLTDWPELINESPYDAWLVKAENVTEGDELMSAAEYAEYLETL
ncbi:MAG: glycine cleavage system protein GcvH [Ruminococcaceae bacterium]|nr:glycine cleavage system protein GcvH [Oscillospiraceae bacterium]